MADTATDLIAGYLHVEYGSVARTSVLAAISALVLFPVCCLPSLAPLGTASLVGVGGVVITAGAMSARLLDGSCAARLCSADM